MALPRITFCQRKLVAGSGERHEVAKVLSALGYDLLETDDASV
jgi:hypothetical protein